MTLQIAVIILAVVSVVNGIFINYLLKRISELEIKLSVHTTRLNNQTDCLLLISGILNKIEKDFYNEENN